MYEYYYTHCAGDEVGDAMALFSAMSKEGWREVIPIHWTTERSK